MFSVAREYNIAPSDLQPHCGNGVLGNVYLLALDNTRGCTKNGVFFSAASFLFCYGFKTPSFRPTVARL